ncbi:hypothetical protein Ciccas_002088 [Cichlidogyrus casuarinus]|uniref:Uncharacterized protein n=1 Tax=Cichlidogyrus casuarinus TaxID=1844966 RepID=A0ABD2QIA7_9PLAT
MLSVSKANSRPRRSEAVEDNSLKKTTHNVDPIIVQANDQEQTQPKVMEAEEMVYIEPKVAPAEPPAKDNEQMIRKLKEKHVVQKQLAKLEHRQKSEPLFRPIRRVNPPVKISGNPMAEKITSITPNSTVSSYLQSNAVLQEQSLTSLVMAEDPMIRTQSVNTLEDFESVDLSGLTPAVLANNPQSLWNQRQEMALPSESARYRRLTTPNPTLVSGRSF